MVHVLLEYLNGAMNGSNSKHSQDLTNLNNGPLHSETECGIDTFTNRVKKSL